MGSWFIFFVIVEDMGKTELAISNIMRAVYLVFMIPCWGYASGINTIVSNLIGKNQINYVFKATTKTAFLCFATTMSCTAIMLLFPEVVLRIGTDDMSLVKESIRLTWVLTAILAMFLYWSHLLQWLGRNRRYQSSFVVANLLLWFSI